MHYPFDSLPEDIQATLKERMKPDFILLYHEDGSVVIPSPNNHEHDPLGYCRKTGRIICGIKAFYRLEYGHYLTKEERDQIDNDRASEIEKARFEKAEKIKSSDLESIGIEQFYSEDAGFIPELDYFFDAMIEAHGFQYEKYPKYVWATKPEPVIGPKDAFRVYESDMDDLSDECDWPVKGEQKLQEALDSFVEENSGMVAYYPDYSTAILIDEDIEEFRKRYEDEEEAIGNRQ